MEVPSREIEYLTLEEVIELNRRLIEDYGGDFSGQTNILNEGPILYVLDAIQGTIFGTDLYPSVKEKAAALAHSIITSHVFFDGNKRTGMFTAWLFLMANGVVINLDPSIVDLAVKMADQRAGYQDFLGWLHAHQ